MLNRDLDFIEKLALQRDWKGGVSDRAHLAASTTTHQRVWALLAINVPHIKISQR